MTTGITAKGVIATPGIPEGGTTGQALKKSSNTDYAVEWGTVASSASDVAFTPAGNIASTDVQAAIEELDAEKSSTSHNHDASYQPLDAGLTDISALAVTDGNIIVGDGANWVAESGATARTSLGAAAASHTHSLADITDAGTAAAADTGDFATAGHNHDASYQPLDAGLTDIAALAVTDGNIIVGDGANWVAESGATARTSLGAAAASHTHSLADITDDGTIASQNANNVSITGGSITGITDLAVADGGTGASDAATARDNLDVPHDLSVMYANRLINGEFRIWQRGTSLSAQADDSYGAMGDRWYILTQTGTIAGARQSAPFDGARNSGQLTQSQASAQRIGAAQIIENINCQDLRGQAVVFYGRFKCSVDQDIRFAILEWTGTADSVTSDFVLDWTSTTYTAGNFFTTTSTTVTAVKEYASPGTGWVDFFVTGTLGSSLNNICVMAWTEGTLAQNGTLSLANCGFIRGSAAPTAHTARPFTQELVLCQRYYCKTFNVDVTPAQSSGTLTGILGYRPRVTSITDNVMWFFPVTMRATPTLTFYNYGAANNKWRNFNDAADSGTPNPVGTSDRHVIIDNPQVAGDGVGEFCIIHGSAQSEL